MPHLYCLYADDGMPYEGFEHYLISNDDSYHFKLQPEGRVELDRLLQLRPERQDSWEFLK
jgi:hypothetical protein